MAGWAWHLIEGANLVADLGDVAVDKKVTWRLSEPGEASFSIPGDHPVAGLARELVTDVVVSYDGARMWRGRIGATSDDLDGTSHDVSVAAVDYRGRLERRLVWTPKSWTTLSPVDAAWDLISQAQALPGGAEGITSAARPTGTAMTLDAKWGTPIAAVVDSFASMWDGQFDWWIDGDRVFNAETFRGGPRDFALVYGETVSALSRAFDPAGYANLVRASGADGIAPSVASVAGLATRPEGRWETQIGDTNLATDARVAAFATHELERLSAFIPDYRWTLTPGVWTPNRLWIGDTPLIRVKSGRLNVNTTDRVQEITVSESDAGTDVDVVTGGSYRSDLARILRFHGRQLSALARR